MQRSLFLTVLIGLGSLFATAQQPTPSPSPSPEDSVVKISTQLIQIDATVTDKDGKVVTDLTPADFELYENGELQKISNFSFVSKTLGGATVGNATAAAAGQTSESGGTLRRSEVRRTIAIVVDDLNLSFASVYYARKALNRFVDDQMLPDDLVAVIRTAGGVGALQQFTSDKRLLKAAIAKIRWNPLGGSLDALSPVSQRDNEITDRFNNESDQVASGNPKQYTLLHPHDNVDQVQAAIKNASKNSAAQEASIYMQTSLGTIKYIIAGMKELPGRKAMMLFSDGMAITSDSDKSRASNTLGYLQDVTDVANRSSVVIYTFDTRGLQSMAITASDSTYEIIDGHRAQKVNERERDFKESQDGLVYFANRTGGKALLDSNDLNGGIQRALDEQAGYYLLGYVPDAEAFDPNKRKFNKFEVKVKRPGLKVSYRSGFFSNDPGNEAKPVLNAERRMAEALMSPFVQSDISLNINALYALDPVDGPYVRSFLHIDARSLTFTDIEDGWKTATFDIAAVAFGDNGIPVDHSESKYTIKTKGATYETMLQKGFVYTLVVPVKKPGLYQYRVALRDAVTGKIGSATQVVEIPDTTKQKLTMSTLAVEDVSMNTWQYITQGKVGNGPGKVQIPSTLLYDTVLRQFPAGTVLRYGFEVYNAKRDGSQTYRLETQARILQNDKALVEGNTNKFEAVAQDAAPNPRVSGAILLKDTLPPGDYVLQVIVRDLQSKQQTTTQLFRFEIIK